MSRNDGKALEQLVTIVEGMGLPPGFTITTNDRVFNDDGVQIAELDILIEGFIGTIPHRILIECRDRPSQGAAGGDWIQQLIGRRQTLVLNTVVAVSTTGFSPAAIHFASQNNIPLRSVETLTEADVVGLFPFTIAPALYQTADYKSVNMELMDECKPLSEFATAANSTKLKMMPGDEAFLSIKTDEKLTVLQLWTRIVNDFSQFVFDGVVLNADATEKTFSLDYEQLRDYRVIIADRPRQRIVKLTATAVVSLRQSPMPFANAVSYGEGTALPTILTTYREMSELGCGLTVISKMKPDSPT